MGPVKPALLLLALLGPLARAADVTLTATVDRNNITMNDTLTLQLTVAGGRVSVSRPTLPALPGFRATFAGQSQNFSFVNGKVSSQVVFTYALSPLAPGDHVIPAIPLNVEGRTLSTAPISVKVLTGGPAAGPAGDVARDNVAHGGRNLFVTTTVDKKTATVGEQITLLFRFYTRAPLLSQPNYQPPDTTGFMIEDLPPQRQYVAAVEGVRYQVVELATALFPTTSGKFTIGPAALECRVQDFRDPAGGGFFDDFFRQSQNVVLRSDPLSITVRPVPDEGRPAGFRGDVGRFKLAASLDKGSVQVHEPLTLTVVISGEGNVKSVSAPTLPAMKEFKTYETLSSLNIEKKDGKVRGSKVFTTVLKPDVSGDLTLPALSFSYFDPQAQRFNTVATPPLSVRVRPGDPSAAPAPGVSFVGTGEGLKEIGRDIRFIKTRGRWGPRSVPFLDRPWFLAAQALPGILFLGIWGGRALGQRGRARFSPTAARRALRAIDRVQANPGEGGVAALQRIFLDYLGAKLKTNPQGLTSDAVRAGLNSLGYSPDIIQRVDKLWNDFDQVRYSPAAPGDWKWGERLTAVVRSLEAKR